MGPQTDNIFNIRMEAFINKKEGEIIEAKFKAKSQIILETGASGDFNGCRMTIEAEFIIVVKKNQVEKLVLVDIKDNAKKQQYVEQCTCGAYIASIYQPKATFNYSIAAQSKKLSNKDIAIFNKRIQLQLDHKLYSLCFKAIDLSTAKLFVFVDRSFANNKDQSSQIGYVIVLANKYSHANTNKFTIKDNTIY